MCLDKALPVSRDIRVQLWIAELEQERGRGVVFHLFFQIKLMQFNGSKFNSIENKLEENN